jgi:hypothetical protein
VDCGLPHRCWHLNEKHRRGNCVELSVLGRLGSAAEPPSTCEVGRRENPKPPPVKRNPSHPRVLAKRHRVSSRGPDRSPALRNHGHIRFGMSDRRNDSQPVPFNLPAIGSVEDLIHGVDDGQRFGLGIFGCRSPLGVSGAIRVDHGFDQGRGHCVVRVGRSNLGVERWTIRPVPIPRQPPNFSIQLLHRQTHVAHSGDVPKRLTTEVGTLQVLDSCSSRMTQGSAGKCRAR